MTTADNLPPTPSPKPSSAPRIPPVPPVPGETVTIAVLAGFIDCPTLAMAADVHQLVDQADVAYFALRLSDLPIGAWQNVGYHELDAIVSVPATSWQAAAALANSGPDAEFAECADTIADLTELGIAGEFDDVDVLVNGAEDLDGEAAGDAAAGGVPDPELPALFLALALHLARRESGDD